MDGQRVAGMQGGSTDEEVCVSIQAPGITFAQTPEERGNRAKARWRVAGSAVMLASHSSRTYLARKSELNMERNAKREFFMKTDGRYESIEYTLPNNSLFRAALHNRPTPWVTFLRESIFVLVGIFVGLVGFLMRTGIESLTEWRIQTLFTHDCEGAEFKVGNCTRYELRHNAGQTYGLYVAISCCLVLVSAALVVFIAPAAAASGLPEVIAFLNGTLQSKLFNLATFVIKFLGWYACCRARWLQLYLTGAPRGSPSSVAAYSPLVLGCQQAQRHR